MSADDPAAQFLEGVPEDRREAARAVHEVVVRSAPDLERWLWRGRMWGGTDQTILGYGRYEQVNRSGEAVRWFVIGLANQKRYLSLYVSAVREGLYLPQVYGDRLGRVRIGASSVSFRRFEDLDVPALELMLQEAAAFHPG